MNISITKYAERFVELLHIYRPKFGDNPDFCFSFGLGLSMFYYYFVPQCDQKHLDEYEALGKELLNKAQQLNPLYKKLSDGKITPLELQQLFSNRMCLAKYYGIA